MIERFHIWKRKNYRDRFLNDERQEVNSDESNGKRLVSEKLDAGYPEYVMGRRYQQTGRFNIEKGKIIFDGKSWNRKSLSKIGALIENPPIYENLSARENLKVRQQLLGTEENRIDEVLQVVSLTETGKKKAGQFSLEMKQRLGIAMALLGNPELLILDEPTNGLDPIGIEELRELIRSFPKQGITVILSSHILSEVQLIADKIGIISNGILGYEGELEQGQNLEELFMDVVKENKKAGGILF